MMSSNRRVTSSSSTFSSSFNSVNGTKMSSSMTSSNGTARPNMRSSRRSSAFSGILSGSQDAGNYVFVQHAADALKRKSMAELGSGMAQSIENTSFVNLVEYIRSERLATLPHKGSRWDTALIRALFFAEKLHQVETVVAGFASGSSTAAKAGYGHAQLLLSLGHENSAALEKAFGLFYKSALSIAPLLDHSDLLSVASESREEFCLIYTDLLNLVVDVATRFYKAVHGMTGASVSLDMYEVFGDVLDSFRTRRMTASGAIWKYRIESADMQVSDSCSIDSLRSWLAPQDRVLTMMSADHTTFTDQQAEFTCIWLHDELVQFIKSKDKALLLNGRPGAGKTTLAAAICERLHRQVARKTYTTVFTTTGIAATQRSSLHVVKSILAQLLDIWTGNMTLYRALVGAREVESSTVDPQAYEELLWTALTESLGSNAEHETDAVFVVDGLDELAGGTKAGQAVLERLANIVNKSQGCKLVSLSQGLSLPEKIPGLRREITSTDTRDDLHSVAIRHMAQSHHFVRSKSGPEQEAILASIIDAADGSFIWCSLFCEVLKTEKTVESFTKTVQNAKAPMSINDLIVRLWSVLQPSHEAKALLSWLVGSARPLTFQEIECFFSTSEDSDHIDRRANAHTVSHTIEPFLAVRHDVVRVRHSSVLGALRTLMDQSKLDMAVKDRPMDLLQRSLKYAKSILGDKGEPTFDTSNMDLQNRLFTRNALLEYVIRYWTFHLHQTPFYSKDGKEVKAPSELQKVFPDSTTMPILERICWDSQFAGAIEVELHVISGNLRRQFFTQDSPSVLQSYMNAADYYDQLEDVTNSTKYYYLSTIISNTVLGGLHPVTVSCATSYMRITGQVTETKRTEFVSQYERVLTILVAAYERQYGASSELVIETRQQLISLYTQIKEEARVRELTLEYNGYTEVEEGGEEETDLTGHLRVQLGKTKEAGTLETFKDDLVVEDIKEEKEQQLDIRAIKITEAKSDSQFIQMWQETSMMCSSTRSLEWHEKKLDVVNSYGKFLISQKRQSEAKALLSSAYHEYQNHDLAFAEGVVSRLTETAAMLKALGCFGAALAIFKHAGNYHATRGNTRQLSSLEEEISVTSHEVVKRSGGDDATVESSFDTILSKKLDANTLAIAKKMIINHMAQKEYTKAVDLIHKVMSFAWPSLLSATSQKPTLPAQLLPQCVEIVKLLPECYIRQSQTDKVDDVYLRLFRSALTAPHQNKDLLEDLKKLLISWYDKRGYSDRSIAILQDILPVYKREVAHDSPVVIQTLYDLGSRCRHRARNFPYWPEYYEQITKALNKDPKTCHPDAVEAALIVAYSYWEERRFSEAVPIMTSLWNLYRKDPKKVKQFSDVSAAETFYGRYYQALESVHTEWETLYTLTKEWRSVVRVQFGAESTVSREASVSVARLAEQSEKHSDEAIAHYEEAAKMTSAKGVEVDDVKQILTTLYRRRVVHQSSDTSSTEGISRAVQFHQNEFDTARKTHGYGHESTLSNMQSSCVLLCRQGKTEVAIRELTAAITEINMKESEEKMFESAKSIAHTFRACNQQAYLTQITDELHRQLILKEKSSKFSFDLTQKGSSSLFFLAALVYYSREDQTQAFSQILSDLKLEFLKIEEFRQTLTGKLDAERMLSSAAPLRSFLIKRGHKETNAWVDERVVQVFMKQEMPEVQLTSKQSSAIFVSAIMDHLSTKKTPGFVWTVILAANSTVQQLIAKKSFAEAYDVANMAFSYTTSHNGYKSPTAIYRGMELAALVGGYKQTKCTDQALRKKLLQLSNVINKDMISICKKQKFGLAQFRLNEVSRLIALFGEQEDYDTLESILSSLWNTRDAQAAWSPQVLLNLAQRLICARFLAGHPVKAVRLCEDISYNLRRVQGTSSSSTIETYALLAELYTSTGQYYQKSAAADKSAATLATTYFKKAVLVHEDILRWLVSEKEPEAGSEDIDGDDEDTAAAILAEHGVDVDAQKAEDNLSDSAKGELAKTHLRLLRFAYQRFGGWPKPYAQYERLNAAVFRVYGAFLTGAEGVEKWVAKGFGEGKAQSADGSFVGAKDWEIVTFEMRSANGTHDEEL